MDHELKITIMGVDQASPALRQVQDEARKTAEALNSISGGGSAGGSAGGGAGGAGWVDPYKNASKEIDALAEANKKVGQSATGANVNMGHLASGMARLFGITGPTNTAILSLAGTLGTGALVGGAAVALKQVTELVFELGNLGEQATQASGRFTVFSDGVVAAADNLTAMREATQGGTNDMAAMETASKLLSMGIAKNSEELAANVEAAVMLGQRSMSSEQRITDWVMMLANQSVRRLDNFGISVDALRKRQDELTSSAYGLEKGEAFAQAALELATVKVDDLKAAGVEAVTSTQQLTSAWQNLRIEIGKNLEGPTSGIKEWAASQINDFTQMLALDSPDATVKLIALNEELERTREIIDELKAGGVIMGWDWEANGDPLLVYQGQLEDLTDAIYDTIVAQQILNGTTSSMDVGARIWETFPYTGPNMTEAPAPAIKTYGDIGLEYVGALDLEMGLLRQKADEATQRILDKEERERDAANKRIAAKFEAAFNEVSSGIAGKINNAISISKGLTPPDPITGKRAPGEYEAGGNGPFENLYRAKDIAVHGTAASPWDEVLGLDQETATRIVRDFENGLLTEEVKALVDKDQLIADIKREQLASQLIDAFADEIATAAGGGKSLVLSMFGYGEDSSKTPAGITEAGSKVATATVGAIDKESGKAIKSGEGIINSFITGLNNKQADLNSTVRSIVDSMLAAIAAAVGNPGSVAGSAAADGVKP